MLAEQVLDDGTILTLRWNKSTGITSNCGMADLASFSFYGRIQTDKAGWGSTYIEGKYLLNLWEEHKKWVISNVLLDYSTTSIVAISDRILSNGSVVPMGCCLKTSHLLKELIKQRIGSVTLSPLVRNKNYSEGGSDIVAAFWIPPNNSIVAEGAHYPYTDPVNVQHMNKRKKAYAKWLGE